MLRGEAKSAFLDSEGVLRINGHICVPKVGDWVHLFLEEAHCAKYSIHSGVEKMFHDLKQHGAR